ncbi:MAG TPA: hypothetical protein VMT89_07180 [Candidatus Acidoferrales bacterium]|nr:hypothetical protein [Candidatus Acidoferrales bacterium]
MTLPIFKAITYLLLGSDCRLWAGLLTEAGEVRWPGYERKAGRRISGNKHQFDFGTVNMEIGANAICYAGIYMQKSGGEPIRILPITDNHPQIHSYDTVSIVMDIELS